ncbi:hypothetical protein HK405_002668, partial [Cladochytrium tenue]
GGRTHSGAAATIPGCAPCALPAPSAPLHPRAPRRSRTRTRPRLVLPQQLRPPWL